MSVSVFVCLSVSLFVSVSVCQFVDDAEEDSEYPRPRQHRAARRKSAKKPITQVRYRSTSDQGDHSPGKAGKVREFQSGQ